MADVSFSHGVRVSESADTPVLIRTAQSAVVCLLGTAPDADASAFPLDEPVLLKGSADTTVAAKLGAAGTLKDALDAVWDQIGAYVHIIRVAEGVDAAATLSNLVGDATALTGAHAIKKIEGKYGRNHRARLVAAPGFSGALATDGIASIAIGGSGGSGYDEGATVTVSGGGGSGAEIDLVIEAGVITGTIITKPGHGYTEAPTLAIANAGDGADATLTASVGTVGNPLAHELVGILEQNRAVAFIDGPSSTDEAAIASAAKYGSARLYMVDPKGKVWDAVADAYVDRPLSAHFAGLQAKIDRTLGFASTLSNKPINGIDGPSRPMIYGAQTNLLNENGIGTIVSRGDGWRAWGPRSLSSNSVWRYLNVRRTADMINDALEEAYFEFVDRLPTQANLQLMVHAGQSFLNTLVAEQQIIGGRVWLDVAKNPATEAAQGRWTLSVDFEPYAPMEDIRLIAHRNISYYVGLIDGAVKAIEDGALALPAT